MKTWTLSFKSGKQVQVKALKADFENLRRRLNDLSYLGNTTKELLGEKPENETPEQYAQAIAQACIMTKFCIGRDSNPMPQKAVDFLAALPDSLDTEACKCIAAEARRLYLLLIPVVDKRETKTVREAWRAKHKAIEAEREEKHLHEFVDVWCKSREFIETPAGQMNVYLQLTFDDSDTRSDYFNSHATIGDKMLLAFVLKQAERQDLARRILALYPELAKLEWSWHTENYSMGHGNYLMSEWLPDEMPHSAYDGRKSVKVRWEISFDSYKKKLRPYKDYPGIKAETATEIPVNGKNGVTVRLNAEKQGVEVLFNEKPEQGVIASLKSHGFRWSPAGKLWYAKQNPDKINFANSLTV